MTQISYKSYAIKEEFRSVRSTTFHGRDLFTPAAIEIAKGNFDIVEGYPKIYTRFLRCYV